jgi:predicted nucleic acid-binding protein
MIVVDSSVWIAHLRDMQIPAVAKLRGIIDPLDIIVGDVVLLEVLQGARDDAHAAAIERNLRQFEIAAMVDEAQAVRAARYYRLLRDRGITIRKTIDVIIGAYCLEHGCGLLHDDRDFEPMARYLGLRVV